MGINTKKGRQMTNKLKTQVYHVDIKPIDKLNLETEHHRGYGDVEIGTVQPYGLKKDIVQEIETKTKVEPETIQQHINQEIEKHVISDKSNAPRRQCKNNKQK